MFPITNTSTVYKIEAIARPSKYRTTVCMCKPKKYITFNI